MHEGEFKQCTKSVLAFFRELHGQVDIIPSELIKICDNRVARLIPSRVDLKNVRGVIHGALISNAHPFCRYNVPQLVDPRGVVP